MLPRFGAALCGAAMILLHSSEGMAVTTAAHLHSAGKARVNAARQRLPNRIEMHRAIAATTGSAIEGAASMYDPYGPGREEGGKKTASGEPYNPNAWTAAIQTGLRRWFGGIRFGKDYRHVYALVESADKKAIVKINDVGPLRPGRIIDLNTHAMRYFDPTLQRGVIHHIKVTPLVGHDWTTGPVDGEVRNADASQQRASTAPSKS